MAKVSIDIEYIKSSLENMGYRISDVVVRENQGINWQFKFSNSGAMLTIYDTNKRANSVVGGKCEPGEQTALKELADKLKCKDLIISLQNREIVELIERKHEGTYWDFKKVWHENSADMLHDIICLSNNTENRNAYLIIGVANNYTVVGVTEKKPLMKYLICCVISRLLVDIFRK